LVEERISARSGSKWTTIDLDLLRIEFEAISMDEFIAKLVPDNTYKISDKAHNLINKLSKMPSNLSASFDKQEVNRSVENPDLQIPLVKASYLVNKYMDQESIVDSFMHLLLENLGFFEAWLYAFPQMKMPLMYGADKKWASADFTILDVLSFYRLAVVEDKRFQNQVLNSEPQLIAEAIALQQANSKMSKKRKKSISEARAADVAAATENSSTMCSEIEDVEGNVFGVRLNGLTFFFYVIPLSNSVLSAMENKTRAREVTTVFRLQRCSECRFDWMKENDRIIIITMMDALQACASQRGAQSIRRNSASPSCGSGK